MPEFVIVTYPVRRRVIINGAPNGFTNDPLIVSRATHQFDLGTPADYTPLSRTVAVAGTGPTAPLTIAFQPLAAVATTERGATVAPPAASRARKAPKATARRPAARKKVARKKTGRKAGKKSARKK